MLDVFPQNTYSKNGSGSLTELLTDGVKTLSSAYSTHILQLWQIAGNILQEEAEHFQKNKSLFKGSWKLTIWENEIFLG